MAVLAIVCVGSGLVLYHQHHGSVSGYASLEITYSNPEGLVPLSYRLSCRLPLAGTSDPSGICAEIQADPSMVLPHIESTHSCLLSLRVGVRGVYLGRRVHTAFSPCLTVENESALQRWTSHLPTLEQETAVQPDRALGLIRIGETRTAVTSLLGLPQASSHGITLYRIPSVGCRTAVPGFLAIDFDSTRGVQTIVSNSPHLVLEHTPIASLVHECIVPYPGPDLHALKGIWHKVSCDKAPDLTDHAQRGPATIIIPAPDSTVTIVSSHFATACRSYSTTTRASLVFQPPAHNHRRHVGRFTATSPSD
jgi:hypothetical protein